MADEANGALDAATDLKLTIPLYIEVRVRVPEPVRGFASAAQTATALEGELERIKIDRDYSNRSGYDKGFLGVEVPLPELTDEQRRNAARIERLSHDEDDTLLHYHHFSIVMNRRRQLAYYTAVNIDGAQSRKIRRERDTWFFDTRIAESEQIGEDLYRRNRLDRGHLVRREDPVWGETDEDAQKANNDSFHFTNCSPQHEQFNQNETRWLGIENHILSRARVDRKRVTVFTGPVMLNDDPLYKGVRLPRAFWKIVVYRTDESTGAASGDSLKAAGFLLWQDELIENGLEARRFDPEVYQVPVSEIVERTGLQFHYLQEHDRLSRPDGEEALEKAVADELTSLEPLRAEDAVHTPIRRVQIHALDDILF
jgi:endonuclease G